jgi:hypothetical protein
MTIIEKMDMVNDTMYFVVKDLQDASARADDNQAMYLVAMVGEAILLQRKVQEFLEAWK